VLPCQPPTFEEALLLPETSGLLAVALGRALWPGTRFGGAQKMA